jgi:Subtilase family
MHTHSTKITILLLLAPLCAAAGSLDAKPPVPPGVDPGGLAIAIVGNGIDYGRSDIARRLARDGEGELIGWDFADNDRRPFKSTDELESVGYTHRGTAVALTLLKRTKSARLIAVKIPAENDSAVIKSLALVAQTPARVAVLTLKHNSVALWSSIREAMRATKSKFLLIVSTSDDSEDPDRIKEHLAPTFDFADAVLVVSACDRNGDVLTTPEGAETNADVAVNAEAFTSEPLARISFNWKPESSIAAAEIAALAARLIEFEPTASPAAVKSAIMSFAAPFRKTQVRIAKSGWIVEPWRHFPQD